MLMSTFRVDPCLLFVVLALTTDGVSVGISVILGIVGEELSSTVGAAVALSGIVGEELSSTVVGEAVALPIVGSFEPEVDGKDEGSEDKSEAEAEGREEGPEDESVIVGLSVG
jgi:hypothetical protein